MKTKLLEEREALVPYLLAKYRAEDWHAVCDAAMDLRDIDSALKALEYMAGANASVRKNAKFRKTHNPHRKSL